MISELKPIHDFMVGAVVYLALVVGLVVGVGTVVYAAFLYGSVPS